MDKDIIGKSILAGIGSVLSFLFGGWPSLLQILLFFIVMDYITGLLAAGYEGKINSQIGFTGIARKIFIFFMVSFAHQIDIMIGHDQNFVFDSCLFFYIANEMISILENGGKLGVPIPDIIKKAIERIEGKARKKK